MKLEIFYSYACSDTYSVYRWLTSLRDWPLEVTWSPFTIATDHETGWDLPWDHAGDEVRAFRAAAVVRELAPQRFAEFHEALERAVYEEGSPLGDETTLADAARAAGIDPASFRLRLHAAGLDAAARTSHERAKSALGVSGTPTLLFEGALPFQLELTGIPPTEAAEAVYEAVRSLATRVPYVGLLRRASPEQRAD